MSFISASWGDYGKIIVWEKNEQGKRIQKIFDPVYYFYIPDSNGKYLGIDGTKLSKLSFKNKNDFEIGLRTERVRDESDFSVMERVLMDNYLNCVAPVLNVAFLDIEVDYDPEIGFARVSNAYAAVSALTMFKTSTKKFTTFVIPPEGWNGKFTEKITQSELVICENEKELLQKFLLILDDVDVISGWNSEFFDLPYLAVRIERVLGSVALKLLNFKDSKNPPKWKEVERFGVKEQIIELEGRVHLDYLKLFKKFNLEGRSSFSLASIADDELDIPKLTYDGSLYDLYRNDFTKFIQYNIRDTEILVSLDNTFKYIELANNMVHEATVNFNSVFGSVNLIDTAITNFAHKQKLIVMDKRHTPGERVEGAIVMTPKIGFWKWIFSCDINSLYPSVMRSNNLSIEKIVGQFTRRELDWEAIFSNSEEKITLQFENENETLEASAQEWKEILKTKKWCVTAYGTVLDQSSGEGLIPSVLKYWFEGRKELQKKEKEWSNKAEELLNSGKSKNDKDYIEFIKQSEYYNMLQGVRKVLLNSTYGATLNEFCRFHDARLGASTTASGRQITRFMIKTIGNLISGKNTDVIKHQDDEGVNQYTYDGNEIIYGDTDSIDGDSIIDSSEGMISIKNLFNLFEIKKVDNREFSIPSNEVKCSTLVEQEYQFKKIKAIYRHKVSKQRFKITDEFKNKIIVTEDHSIMIERNKKLIDVKPMEILSTDLIISYHFKMGKQSIIKSNIKKIKQLDNFNDEYVYDIIMEDSIYPFFFANNILVHNSCYASLENLVSKKEDAIKIADEIVNEVNNNFSSFMKNAFLCNSGYDNLIYAKREVVAESSIFQAKKKYMLYVVNLEGKNLEREDKKSFKTMGSDIKTSTTPEYIKQFLKKITLDILYGVDQKIIENFIIEFRSKFNMSLNDSLNPLSIATQGSAKVLEDYYQRWSRLEKKGLGKVSLPGHIRASINYNECLKSFNDKESQPITSGSKIKLVYLKKNDYNFKSLAFPADTIKFPSWFNEYFQVDMKIMEEKLIDNKLSNIFDALEWSVPTAQSQFNNSIFVF